MKHTLLKAFALGLALAAAPVFAAVPDGLITAKAKMALWTSEVRSTAVRVDTNEGVVTLSGKVPTGEKKALAEQKVRGLDGVRSVKNLLQVVPAAEEKRVETADKDLEKKAKQALEDDAALENAKITVRSVENGVVILGGEAQSYTDQLRAVALVDGIPGVRRVNSQVKGPDALGDDDRTTFTQRDAAPTPPGEARPGEARRSVSDTRITGSVKMRLLTAAQIPSMEISVDTVNGVVTLFGMVPTAQVKRSAEAEAARVSGVSRVENQLEVVSSAQKETAQAKDEDITRDLKLAFKDRPDLENVNTSVKNGVVQLTGKVASGWEELSAVRTARMVKGVRGVTNQLEVEHHATPRKDKPGS